MWIPRVRCKISLWFAKTVSSLAQLVETSWGGRMPTLRRVTRMQTRASQWKKARMCQRKRRTEVLV